MKDFFKYRQQLSESSWTDALNDLQSLWNKDAEKYITQKVPLWPMFSRPFDRVVRNGVLVLGINPGSKIGGKDEKERKKLYDKFSGEQPPVWDEKSRTWRNIDFDKVPEGGGTSEKEIRLSVLDPEQWNKRGGDSTSPYIKGWNNLFDKLGRDDLKGKVMMANLYPFASNNISALPKGSSRKEMDRLAQKWVTGFIKSVKPKVVIVAGGPGWDAMKPMLSSTEPLDSVPAIGKDGKEVNATGRSLGSIVKAGKMKDGTPVLSFMHPSSQTGQPNGPSYKDEKTLSKIRGVVNKYVK